MVLNKSQIKKICNARCNSRMRGLGFNPLNFPIDKNTECHHLDKKNVIFIPAYLHKLFKHTEGTESCNDMNILAFAWLESSSY